MSKRDRARRKFHKKLDSWYSQLLIPRCVYCGHLFFTRDNISVDHYIPLSNGGTNDSDNLLPACRDCNSRKGNSNLPKLYPRFHRLEIK